MNINYMRKTILTIITSVFILTVAFADRAMADEVMISSDQFENLLELNASTSDDLNTKVVGSDGIRHEEVTYLSVAALSRLSEDKRAIYYDFCDDISELSKNGCKARALAAVDENGELIISFKIPRNFLFSEEIAGQFMDGESEALDDDESEAYPEKNANVLKDHATDAPANEYLSENMDSLLAMQIEEKSFIPLSSDVQDVTRLGLSVQDNNYFRDQLNSVGKNVFDAVYEAAKQGSNISYVVGETEIQETLRGICAAMITYVESFEWVGQNLGIDYNTKTGNTDICFEVSKYYSESLESKAQAKINTLAAAARSYALTNYPDDYSYGVVKYIDEWVCKNNYYNNAGIDYTGAGIEKQAYYYCHTSYGILLKGYGVCESYAKAVHRLLEKAGVRSLYTCGMVDIDGDEGGHAWNHVNISGKWYLLDSTWDDAGKTSNLYYMLVGSDRAVDRIAGGDVYPIDEPFKHPEYNTEAYNVDEDSEEISESDKISLTLSDSELALKKGKAAKLTYKLSAKVPKDTKINWESSDKTIAAVNNAGRITAKRPGYADITLTIGGLTPQVCKVYVYDAEFAFNDTKEQSSDAYSVTFKAGKNNKTLTCNYACNTSAFDSEKGYFIVPLT
nr:Ig-like domain-containing protein [Lachnospiraceae bacterium]